MPRMFRRAPAALLPLLLLTGCAQRIDSSDLESKLKDQLSQSAGAEAKSVDCPDDIEIEKGKKFDCTLTAPNGDKVRVEVTLTNEDGGFRALVPPQ
jgi:hypothetical protein